MIATDKEGNIICADNADICMLIIQMKKEIKSIRRDLKELSDRVHVLSVL